MYIAIDLSPDASAPTLAEPDDFKAFKVVVTGGTDSDALAAALAPVGRLADDGHAFITPEGLRSLAGDKAQDPEWNSSLDGMIGYAQSKGWVDESGAIQAHCEYPEA